MGKIAEEKKLSVKHQKFVDGIMSGMSGVDAYLAAGYKSRDRKKLRRVASDLRTKPDIAAEIERRREVLRQEHEDQMNAQVTDAIEARGRLVRYPYGGTAIQMRAIADVLDRAGFKPLEKHEHSGSVEHNVTFKLLDVDVSGYPEQDDEEL